MRLRIREAGDHVEELEDRTWPAVRDEQWKCVLMHRSRMDEMDRLSINRGAEMGELVQSSLVPAPIVRVAPVTNQLAQVVDGNPVLPASALDLIRENGSAPERPWRSSRMESSTLTVKVSIASLIAPAPASLRRSFQGALLLLDDRSSGV